MKLRKIVDMIRAWAALESMAARLATVNTVVGDAWSLTTVTLFSRTLPGLLTVPV